MKKYHLIVICFSILFLLLSGSVYATSFNGMADNETEAFDLYYFISGGKFPTGTTPNGNNGSGGVFRFLTDDPNWGYAIDEWQRDDWFPENAGLALTIKNNNSVIYDNNGLEDGTYGSYYDDTAAAADNSAHPIAGLYMGYEMSNNYDWIYAGYFLVDTPATFDEIIGYFDGTGYLGGFDPDSPSIAYRMNIWSNMVPTSGNNAGYNMPVNTGGFTGDVFSSDYIAGAFSWSDTGAVRKYSGWGGKTDPIYRLTFSLDEEITLDPGIYWFSHDATIVPEPSTWLLFGIGLLGIANATRRKLRK